MKKDIKRDLKEVLNDILIALAVMAIVIPLNRKCSRAINHNAKQKTETIKKQQTQHNIHQKATEKTR